MRKGCPRGYWKFQPATTSRLACTSKKPQGGGLIHPPPLGVLGLNIINIHATQSRLILMRPVWICMPFVSLDVVEASANNDLCFILSRQGPTVRHLNSELKNSFSITWLGSGPVSFKWVHTIRQCVPSNCRVMARSFILPCGMAINMWWLWWHFLYFVCKLWAMFSYVSLYCVIYFTLVF